MRVPDRSPTSSGVRADPNVTPMIDVMLVLLIIFMLVVPAVAAGPAAVLPRGANLKAHPEVEGDRTLGIDRAGRYYLDGKLVSHADLPERLHAIYATRTEDRLLYLKADRDLEYGTLQEAVTVASRAGVRVVGMVAESPPSPPSPPATNARR
ncbi:MAG TPA: biopolymer transporter ExbD [Gemmatimonadaceae bacterium]|nr:biopolymer transporter ExbD [Gemmatimonadaceae bacterium]